MSKRIKDTVSTHAEDIDDSVHRGHLKEERGFSAPSFIKTEDSRHRMNARGFGLQSRTQTGLKIL